MDNSKINEILEKLHQSEGFPRLEIEGGKYPVNEELLKSYRESKIKVPKQVGGFLQVDFDGDGSDWQWWVEHDGFGGQIGSVNISSDYLQHLGAEKGNRCVYVLKDRSDWRDYYYTEIDREYILFRKSDLVRVIETCLESDNKVAEEIIAGIRIVDNVIWDDSIPTGPCASGPKITGVRINLQIDLQKGEPIYKIIV